MLKRLSLRARLTLLSALVTGSVALALTAVSFFSANRIFMRELPQELTYVTISTSEHLANETEIITGIQRAGETKYGEIQVSPRIEPQGDISEVFQVTLAKAGREFNLWGLAGLLFVALLGPGVTWLMAGHALKPVRELSAAIGEIGGSDLSRRVPTHNGQDEIGRLAQAFNGMMDKVSASFDRQKRFSANAAHELRTPLATMQVGLEVLELDEHPCPARMEKALSVARTNTARMTRLVEDLFRLSSDEKCELCDELVLFDLLSELTEELSSSVQDRGLTFAVSANPDLKLMGNRTMLYRAFFNLTENAVKYNRTGGTILLSAHEEKNVIVVEISDTGIGIAPEELARIFEPFYRVDRSRSRAVGGSGLGLALAQDIVEKHGGSISVESVPGEGTTFTLRFPILQGQTETISG